ncbi:MAG: [FeFe] hydrogenase H-cluster radical SAM maturase HydE [Clostridiaceae bacterium]|nr:[FeFe] hydrogenase H-cluster radical SAM maturase HydE [Clostridiaceae bacterium]
MDNYALIDRLNAEKSLTHAEWTALFDSFDDGTREYASSIARRIAIDRFGNGIYFRGIIEFTNICKNNCYYCGIRAGNPHAVRYRLEPDTILDCCESGYAAGFRTFVLQGGEDPYFTDDRMAEIVSVIHARYPDCAITLSIGERTRESYERLYRAGANRYLLRHETANRAHYERLHPASMSFDNRMRCLRDLKAIGYQTGCGMMIGSPFQTAACLADDMLFMRAFKPEMIGIGPFLPHHDTPFRDERPGGLDLTLLCLSLCRIMLPDVLLPATTALGTAAGDGRKRGVLAGANVIMPNLSPKVRRKDYMLYDNKAVTGDDAAESLNILRTHLSEIGYELRITRGDFGGK